MKIVNCILFILLLGGLSKADLKTDSPMVLIPGGEYVPFFSARTGKPNTDKNLPSPLRSQPIRVNSFWLDQFPVTVKSYLFFLKSNPQWRKSKIKSIFTDTHYLESWKNDLRPDSALASPITQVSWFAANAYCEWLGKKLPTMDQWEYVALDSHRNADAVKDKILQWYGKPNTKKLAPVGRGEKNGFGIYDLYGLIWEWTFDFNSLIAGSEGRDSNKDSSLFCGAGGLNSLDASDYAAFMRFSFRNSLKANYSIGNLGFRCAKDVKQ